MKNIIVERSSFVILLIENYLFKSNGFEEASAKDFDNILQEENPLNTEDSQKTEDS
ncbi:hypothetical protein LIV57_20665 [Chryseobacterium sp. X308]|uniref:hypothetical protein n=1 Tax=Chryseobacterium sp. X308 TaxID=2884873 RepID=UPI001D13420D|nr:hypothetical protein [Chryseobacterium sp. X308]MCC3217681.1 hypothetical protein [Chryseobacterium sp. X308]